jgi:putative adenylate-forming enzyme
MFNLSDYILFKLRFYLYSRKMIKSYQIKKAKKIVDYAMRKSPFFKEYYRGYTTFFQLPILNKKVMMDNLTYYNTLGLDKKQLTEFALKTEKSRDFTKRLKGLNIGMSSGTSGNKGIIITTKQEEDYLKTMYLSRLVMPKKQKLNCAFILRVFSPAFNFNKFGHKITYVNQLQSIENICRDIKSINPNVLSSPPSMLKILSNELLKGNLNIKPSLIYSYAETLCPDVKDFIEKTFGCPVLQVYQGSEGCYAVTCKEGSLHINEDIVLFELLNADGSKTEDGNPCNKLLVTDLHKKSQPIIRYELNDVITISKSKCKCGSNFRVIESVQGRADDMLWGRKEGKTHFIFQDYIVREIISCSDKIDDFQVVQKSLDLIDVSLQLTDDSKDESVKEKVIAAVQEVYKKYECSIPKITVKFKKPEPNKNSNKLSRVLCEVDINGKN